MYHSTIPQRSRPITADDFDALEGTCLTSKSRRDGKMRLDIWNQYVPIMSSDIVRIVSAANIPDLKLTCLNDDGGHLTVQLSDGREIIKDVSFEYNLGKKSLNHSLIHLLKHQTGSGSRLFKMTHDLAAAFGYQSLTTSTDMQGGFVWAKRGYEINPGFDTTKLSQTIQARLASIKDCLPPALHANCKMWSYLSDRDDINQIAQLDVILPDHISIDDYYTAGGERGATLKTFFTDAVTGAKHINGIASEMNEIRALIDRREKHSVPIRLNEFLLAGSQYQLNLCFSDDRQMKKVEQHNGAFSFIAPLS